MDLNTATPFGTNDGTFVDAVYVLNGAATGDYYFDAAYLRGWILEDFWYYSTQNVLDGSTYQDFFAPDGATYKSHMVSFCDTYCNYDALRRYVEEQTATVVRANAYIAVDEEREENDSDHRAKRGGFRQALRHAGFKVVPKPVKYFTTAEGVTMSKANADLDLAVDAMLQGQNLDYVVLVSGDGDFTRLVHALQGYGCRVDVVGFHNVSKELREAADFFRSGYLIPDLLPLEEGRHRGFLQTVDEAAYYGHLCRYVGHRPDQVANGVFLHGVSFSEKYSIFLY